MLKPPQIVLCNVGSGRTHELYSNVGRYEGRVVDGHTTGYTDAGRTYSCHGIWNSPTGGWKHLGDK